MFAPWKKSYDQPRQHIKKQRHYFANKGPSSQSYGFSSSHVWMWELDHKESWALKNWCFWTVVLEKTLESPLDCKEIQPVNPKGNQSWILIGRTDTETEAPNTLATWCEELTHLKRPWCWDNHNGVITHLEPDILECEVKWALGSITTNKASAGDGIPVDLFQILKDDVVKVLHSICQQIWKTAVATGLEKVSLHSNPKERQCQRRLKLPHNCTHLTR